MDVEDSKEPATSGANVQLVSRTRPDLIRGGESNRRNSKIDILCGLLRPFRFQSMHPSLLRMDSFIEHFGRYTKSCIVLMRFIHVGILGRVIGKQSCPWHDAVDSFGLFRSR